MAQSFSDPAALIRILMNTDRPNANTPGPQTAAQMKDRSDYAYDLMKNMQLQGGAYYTPTNALADSIRGYMGGRYLDKNDRATKGAFESDALNATQGIMPQWRPPEDIVPSPIGAVSQQGAPQGGTTPVAPKPPGPTMEASASPLDPVIDKVAAETGLDPAALRAYVKIESGGNPTAAKGSYKGLLQLSNSEFKQYGGKEDIFDPEANLRAGAAKLKQQTEAFKAKYGRDPEPADIYMIHQQGEGGYDGHINQPEAPAWENMARTAEGRRMGAKWAKQAIWGNIPKEEQQKFGSVDNVTSGQFMDMWRGRVGKYMPQMKPVFDPNKPMNTNPVTDQGLTFDSNATKSLIGGEPSADLAFDRSKIGTPGNEVQGATPLLDMSPDQIGNEVASAGGVTERAKNPMQPPANTTSVPKNVLPMPKPPEGTIPINAGIPNTQDQFAGTSQTRPPEMEVAQAAEMGMEGSQDGNVQATPAQNQGGVSNPGNSGQNLMQLPTNPTNQITPGMLYNILKSPTMAPEMKKMFMEQAQKQGEVQTIDIEGGKLHYNARTGQQTYVPQPIWKTESIKGISTNVMMIKPKIDGPWQIFDMESGQQVDTSGKGSGGSGGDGSRTGGPIPAGGGLTNVDSGGGGGGGIERRAARARDIERKDSLAKGQTELQVGERKKHAEAGEIAEKNNTVLQRLRQLENAPDINNITTGMTAPAWNEIKKTLNSWLPGTVAKEGPISLHDIYSSIATNAAASMARASDPNPSVRQFEAMLSTNPGYAQTPAGRKALLLSLQHSVDLEREVGKLAKSSADDTNPDAYNRKVQEIRDKYAQKKIIPDVFLNPKFIKSKEFKNMKWLDEGDNPDEKVKVGETFITRDGKVRRRDE